MATLLPPQSRFEPKPPLRRAASDGPVYTTHEPSSPFQIHSDDTDGEQLAAKYQMLEELGSGSFGVVYKAIEKSTGEIVAVKHVDLESSEEDLSDILSELAVLSSCASTHITKYKSAFLRKQTLWIVMEYLGGGSCADLLKPPPHHLHESHIAIICRELLLGLSYLHGEGKLHRDIKAANVLLGMDGRVKLADFGVAAQLTGLKSMRNTFVGTPFWMAPEVIQQEGHDARADVWSLGITAMELANGQPPHANIHPMKVLFQIPKQPAPKLEGAQWSKDFRDFVALCLTKDPDHRPTARQMLKHRFVRHAGRVEGLQELIQKKQEWESSRGGERNLKYYAETLKQLRVPQAEQADEWLFDTVRAAPVRQPSASYTQRRRKSQRTSAEMSLCSEATTMMEDMSIDQTPTRRSSQQFPANSSVRRSSTKKRISSTQQQRPPLGINMSFGNSPSTIRQFRRVSPTVNAENEDPLQSWSMKSLPPDEDVYTSTPMSIDQDSAVSTSSNLSRFSSQASTINSESKEASLGKALYSQVVGLSCQDVLNETGDQARREAVSRVAEAFSDLEAADPEGLYHIMKSIVGRMQADDRLKDMLPKPVAISAAQHSELEEDIGTVQRTPSKAPRSKQVSETRNGSPTKLVLAQNNPHLKSHRRRQSTQVMSRESSQVYSPKLSAKDVEEKQLDKLIEGSGVLPHVSAMESCMYDRWLDGLRVRWPAL
ncbi:hypothetical protein LTR05_002543 [Lithohypha guttulata]|uniref:non-specific serine/threonine protein kinase n=1 Tax=Lithohypha guttulata TaxID=1690604 RepID=A0AAN7T2K9_9EURO|nr:hypothetical protein LTR05_002543 [Lithohypha guttulata]